MRLFYILALGALSLGASCKYAVNIDSSPVFAMDANDATAIIEGCGSQPIVGYTYCKVREGDPTTGTIKIKVPLAACERQSCANVKVFFPDGSPTLGLELPRGETEIEISWKDIVKKDTFEKDARGFWPVLVEWFWVDANGFENRTIVEGEIRMRVLSREYIPLHEIRDAVQFGWRWYDNDGVYRMSTAGRAWAGLN